MSRQLPEYPNLEHLKKQAKTLLRDLQQQNPESKLVDAQHALAREYGFTSWPKLKAYVDSLPRPVGSPFAGSWTANLSKSKRHPHNPFQSATLQFAVSGDTITITHTGVDDGGKEQRGSNTVQADGKERPAGHGVGHVYVARCLGPRVLEVMEKKNDEVVNRGTYEVSEDGETMTISTNEQVIVLDRN